MASNRNEYTRACFNCSTQPAMACARCRLDFYCSKACQRGDWPRHRLFCRSVGEPSAVPEPMAEVDMMDVNDETLSAPNQLCATKQQLLSRVKRGGVRRLMPVYCDHDPAWVLQLLKAAAPLLEELDLWNASDRHWLLLPSMKRLLRLEVNYYYPVHAGGLRLPALPPAAGERLLWLRSCLPRDATLTLVRRHGATLRELQLFVGTAGKSTGSWPWSCGARDLADLLTLCDLRALRRLVLRRPQRVFSLCGDFTHQADQCREQLDAVRLALPSVKQVLCGTCDNVTWKCFEYTIFGMY